MKPKRYLSIYLNNSNYSKLIIKTPKQCHLDLIGVFIANFGVFVANLLQAALLFISSVDAVNFERVFV